MASRQTKAYSISSLAVSWSAQSSRAIERIEKRNSQELWMSREAQRPSGQLSF
jgi:hypothetical protein